MEVSLQSRFMRLDLDLEIMLSDRETQTLGLSGARVYGGKLGANGHRHQPGAKVCECRLDGGVYIEIGKSLFFPDRST
jgi:hypothetical protein